MSKTLTLLMKSSTLSLLFILFSVALFSQEKHRKHNLVVAFDTALTIDDSLVLSQLSAQVTGFSELLAAYDFKFQKTLAFSDNDLERMEKEARNLSGNANAIKNLRNIFDLILPEATDQQIYALKTAFDKMPQVRYTELVSTKPIQPPFVIPPTTPNYLSQQSYIGSNPGVNMQYAWDMGLKAQGIKIIDIEYGFNKNHEEFHQKNNIYINPGYTTHPLLDTSYTEHGTATLGIVVGDNGAYGVTGLAHDAQEVILFQEGTVEYGFNRNYAISLALKTCTAGDVVIYEMQTEGANATTTSSNYVPAEYSQTVWNLTKAATDLGVIVVAAAGNGNQNLDAPEYTNYTNRGNSGAIIVGAGSPTTTHFKLSFSTYGSRVDLQGWGMNVISSGYGDHSIIGGDFNQQYTMFSGTSAATPIVASCVAVLQSY